MKEQIIQVAQAEKQMGEEEVQSALVRAGERIVESLLESFTLDYPEMYRVYNDAFWQEYSSR